MAYYSLGDKQTPYARELGELLALYGACETIWQQAVDMVDKWEAAL